MRSWPLASHPADVALTRAAAEAACFPQRAGSMGKSEAPTFCPSGVRMLPMALFAAECRGNLLDPDPHRQSPLEFTPMPLPLPAGLTSAVNSPGGIP